MLTRHLGAIYRFRGFVLGSVKREFAVRYRNSMLGGAWLVLQPLAQIVVFTVVFAQVMKARLPGVEGTFAYGIFLCAGLLTWGLFAEIVNRCQTVFLDHANLLKKLNFPRISLPVIVILSACANFAIIFGLFTLFLAGFRELPRLGLLRGLSGARCADPVRRRPRNGPGCAERVFPGRRAALCHRPAVLVLAHADRLPHFDPARLGGEGRSLESDDAAHRGPSRRPGARGISALVEHPADRDRKRRALCLGTAAVSTTIRRDRRRALMGGIVVSGLGKAYRQYPTRWSRLAEWLLPWQPPRHTAHWVLREVSFRIDAGEAVGIIGVNGAGKSTLLKLVTGTTLPTTGSVSVAGRLAAMLELGMGFHPDFTGRQNVLMAGQLLGLQEVGSAASSCRRSKTFAEIGEYIDEPIRVYSSGMQMRLAFSVATAVRPDILIVDEALSVGDVYFQHKSFDRIRRFKRDGTSLLFVSHSMQDVRVLCDRVVLLDQGRVIKDGLPDEVVDYYNAMIAAREDAARQRRSGTGRRRLAGHAIRHWRSDRLRFLAA